MCRIHSLCNKEIHLNLEANVIERVESAKLLGVHFTELLDLSEHVRNLLSSCYATQSTLRKIKNVTPYNICKQLVEMLVISKMDYCDIVYDPVPDYQLKRLQHVQNTCTSFINGRLSTIEDVIKLGWLPVRQQRDWHFLKAVHKALHQPTWPTYLRLERVMNIPTTRSSSGIHLRIPMEKNTFQDRASKLFNSLPTDIRNETNYNLFVSQTKDFLLNISICDT